MICDFREGLTCLRCRRPISSRIPERLRVRRCIPQQSNVSDGTECRHFLGATRETVLVFGCGCASAKTEGVPVTVCECELEQHPRCIVFSRGELPADSGVVRCDQCLDRIY